MAFVTLFVLKNWSCAHPWEGVLFLLPIIQKAVKPAFPPLPRKRVTPLLICLGSPRRHPCFL